MSYLYIRPTLPIGRQDNSKPAEEERVEKAKTVAVCDCNQQHLFHTHLPMSATACVCFFHLQDKQAPPSERRQKRNRNETFVPAQMIGKYNDIITYTASNSRRRVRHRVQRVQKRSFRRNEKEETETKHTSSRTYDNDSAK